MKQKINNHIIRIIKYKQSLINDLVSLDSQISAEENPSKWIPLVDARDNIKFGIKTIDDILLLIS